MLAYKLLISTYNNLLFLKNDSLVNEDNNINT